jgi:hypothetical protein
MRPVWTLDVCTSAGCTSSRYDVLGSMNDKGDCYPGNVVEYDAAAFEWRCVPPTTYGDEFDEIGSDPMLNCHNHTGWIYSLSHGDCRPDSDTPGALGCSNGQVIRWSSATSSWSCSDDNDLLGDVASFCMSGGIQLGTPYVSIDTNEWECADIYDYNTLAGITGCTDGDLVQWTGSAWACAADSDVASTFSCAEGQVLKVDTSGAWACGDDLDTWARMTRVCLDQYTNGGLLTNTIVSNGDGAWQCQPSPVDDDFQTPGLVGGAFQLSATLYNPYIPHSNGDTVTRTELAYSHASNSDTSVHGLRTLTRGRIVGAVLTARSTSTGSFGPLSGAEAAYLKVFVQSEERFNDNFDGSNRLVVTASSAQSSSSSWASWDFRFGQEEIPFEVGAQIHMELSYDTIGHPIAVTGTLLIAYEWVDEPFPTSP